MDTRTTEDFQKSGLAIGLYMTAAKACALISLALGAPNAFWPATFALIFVSSGIAAVTTYVEALSREAGRHRAVLTTALQQGSYELHTLSSGNREGEAREFWERHVRAAWESLRGDDELARDYRSLGFTKPSVLGSFAFRLAGDAGLVILALVLGAVLRTG